MLTILDGARPRNKTIYQILSLAELYITNSRKLTTIITIPHCVLKPQSIISLAKLKVNGLYIILFIRNHPPVLNDFHQGLYFHRYPDTSGTKYYITQQGSGWLPGYRPTTGIFKSFLLIGLFRIANVPTGYEGHLDQTIRIYDNQLNVLGITCRIQVLQVLALLQKTINRQVILKYNNLGALETEVKNWGNVNTISTANNIQPRPLVALSLYRL